MISLLASIILCSCLACSVSFISRSAVGGFDVKANEPSIRTASLYGAPTLASLFATHAAAKNNSSNNRSEAVSSDNGSRFDPAASNLAVEEDELRQLGVSTTDGPNSNLIISSIALICISVLAIAISAVVGAAMLAPWLWRRRRNGGTRPGILDTGEDAQKLSSHTSLGTQDSMAL